MFPSPAPIMTAPTIFSAAVPVSVVLSLLISAPVLYLAFSYIYLVRWHNKLSLWSTIIHENGRLTLRGSLFYFDHFIGCVPMIAFFALGVSGGFALRKQVLAVAEPATATTFAVALLLLSILMVVGIFVASVRTVGWTRTRDYAMQRVERDDLSTKGGTWNQLQLSNVPILLGTVALAGMIDPAVGTPFNASYVDVSWGGALYLCLTFVLGIAITLLTWSGWTAFRNPRWFAHSLREVATYPLTAIPIAVAAVILVEQRLSGLEIVTLKLDPAVIVLTGLGVAIVGLQWAYLRGTDVLGLAQRPAFANKGLSVGYLLASHVFEHVLDFVLIAALAGGTYAALRVWTAT